MSADEQTRRGSGGHEHGGHGHGRHGLLAMVACCIPMVLVLVLIAFKVV